MSRPPSLCPRHGIRHSKGRLAAALLGVAVGATGQAFLDRQSLGAGFACYALAATLFVGALARQTGRSEASRFAAGGAALRLRDGWRRVAGIVLGVLALGLSLIAFPAFGREAARGLAWWLYLASLSSWTLGGALLTKSTGWRPEIARVLVSRPVALSLALILGLSVFLRAYHLGTLPFGVWYDEAEAGLAARWLLSRAGPPPAFFPAFNATIGLPAAYAVALAALGDSVTSLRFASVLFGVGGTLTAFLVGRELRGPRFGLVLAFVTAVARWHVTFSRIAMTGIDTPFFELLSVLFLVRLFRTGALRHALWAGLSLGAGLMFYPAFRLYVGALLIFAALAVWRWPRAAAAAWPGHGIRVATIVISVWLVTMPVARSAMDRPGEFWDRARQVSVFAHRDEPDLARALQSNLERHLLMFNVEGDRNGRHNVSGDPILDPAMGILGVLGLGLALARFREPANAFFLILFPSALAGGVLTLDFEAPQSLRSIAAFPAVAYFVALALASLGREAGATLGPLARRWLLLPAGILAAYLLLVNGYTYFDRYATDFRSLSAFSIRESLVGRKLRELGPEPVPYVSPLLANHPTTRFLAPDAAAQRILDLPDALPIRDRSGRPVALFVHPDDEWVSREMRRLYPDATFERLSGPPPFDGLRLVDYVRLEPAHLSSIRGLELRYRRYGDPEGLEVGTAPPPLRVPGVDDVWIRDSQLTGTVAEWTGVLHVSEYGPHEFALTTPSAGRLEIDGSLVVEGPGERRTRIVLAKGNHSLRLRAVVAPGHVQLRWRPPSGREELVPAAALYAPPIAADGLLGRFYPNAGWEGPPALQRIDPFLDTYFHLIPLERPYTVEWTGTLEAPDSGEYRLGLRAVHSARLLLDGRPLVATSTPDLLAETSVALDAGRHDLRVIYLDSVDRSRIHLLWARPGAGLEPIPREFLRPPRGALSPEPVRVPD